MLTFLFTFLLALLTAALVSAPFEVPSLGVPAEVGELNGNNFEVFESDGRL